MVGGRHITLGTKVKIFTYHLWSIYITLKHLVFLSAWFTQAQWAIFRFFKQISKNQKMYICIDIHHHNQSIFNDNNGIMLKKIAQ